MKTITVDVPGIGHDLTVDVQKVSQLKQMRIASRAPDELVEVAEDADSAEDVDDVPYTPEVINYLVDVTTEVTEMEKEDFQDLSAQSTIAIGAEVINTVFDSSDSDVSDKSRRIKRVRATEQVIESLFGGEVTMVAGLPDDAELEYFEYDPSRNELQFIFSSEQWERIDEGAMIPVIEASVVQIPVSDRKI